MAVTINASTTSGLQLSSDTSGAIKLQSDGNDRVVVNTSGTITLPNGTGTAALRSDLFGVGQTWQSVTRLSGTTYTNSTGKPILVLIQALSTAANITPTVGGFTFNTIAMASGTQVQTTLLVPAGSTYSFTINSGTFAFAELR